MGKQVNRETGRKSLLSLVLVYLSTYLPVYLNNMFLQILKSTLDRAQCVFG